jgi:DNA-directed RNA polymerase subunit RPC12/RpoP
MYCSCQHSQAIRSTIEAGQVIRCPDCGLPLIPKRTYTYADVHAEQERDAARARVAELEAQVAALRAGLETSIWYALHRDTMGFERTRECWLRRIASEIGADLGHVLLAATAQSPSKQEQEPPDDGGQATQPKATCTCVEEEPGLVSYECGNCRKKRKAAVSKCPRTYGASSDGPSEAD